jgi:alpha-glucosidase
MNAFTALLRTHEGNQPEVNAQVYSDHESRTHFARFSKVYAALAPYRETLMQEASEKGWPLVRHLWMHHPDDPGALDTDDQFLLGREILVAPIKNKCWTWPICPYEKEVYLPPGRWVHLWSGAIHGQAGSGQTITVAAPIGEPAVFYREGSAVGATFVAQLNALGIAVPAP